PNDGAGQLMCTSATLMERPLPYQFLLELARGKINQLRCQAADWKAGGLVMPDELTEQIHQPSLTFALAILHQNPPHPAHLPQAHRAAHALARLYIVRVFETRPQRHPRPDPGLGCRLSARTPQGEAAEALVRSCNSVALPLSWDTIEPAEDRFFWEPHDTLL